MYLTRFVFFLLLLPSPALTQQEERLYLAFTIGGIFYEDGIYGRIFPADEDNNNFESCPDKETGETIKAALQKGDWEKTEVAVCPDGQTIFAKVSVDAASYLALLRSGEGGGSVYSYQASDPTVPNIRVDDVIINAAAQQVHSYIIKDASPEKVGGSANYFAVPAEDLTGWKTDKAIKYVNPTTNFQPNKTFDSVRDVLKAQEVMTGNALVTLSDTEGTPGSIELFLAPSQF